MDDLDGKLEQFFHERLRREYDLKVDKSDVDVATFFWHHLCKMSDKRKEIEDLKTTTAISPSELKIKSEYLSSLNAELGEMESKLDLQHYFDETNGGVFDQSVMIERLSNSIAIDAENAEMSEAFDRLMSPQDRLIKTSEVVKSEACLEQEKKPESLTTNQIANCFCGFHGWNVEQWKAALGKDRKWLLACQHQCGAAGGAESTWFPVKLAFALYKKDKAIAGPLRKRFESQVPLRQWLDALDTHIPEDA